MPILPDLRPSPLVNRALARNGVQLFLVSSTLLFTELLLIRWIPANVKYVGFFSNFLLMASFLGIGLGILLGRSGRHLPVAPFGPLLWATVVLVLTVQLNVKVSDSQEIFFGLAESSSANVNFVVLPLVIVLATALMAALALPLGPLLRSMPPLRAYAIDIGGSMVGIAAFAILAAAGVGPVAWFAVVAGLVFLQAWGRGITSWLGIGGVCLALAVAVVAYQGTLRPDVWSPYYRITAYDGAGDVVSARAGSADQPRHVDVDGIPHQDMLTATEAQTSFLHSTVYSWFPERTFGRVLIIGAGTGTDTTLALSRGSSVIDAVEIDPEIGRIGREFHPDRVFADPRVHQTINDGRAFLRNSTAQYDLVVFALTDSLTLVSSTANVRLESFLFTEEAFASARDHLAPNGVFVMYNFYRDPWLISKLRTMLVDVYGTEPLVGLGRVNDAVLADGPGVEAARAHGLPANALDAIPDVGQPTPQAAADDWPFLYLRVPTIAPYYLAALGFLLAVAAVFVFGAARMTRLPVRRFSPHFFVLGVAFLLLETKSIVSFSLLFGTTWLVNALTFFAILASVLLAVFVNQWLRLRNAGPIYGALFIALAVAYMLPPESLLIDPPQLRYALAAIVAFSPVFFANLVFTHSFRDTATADMSFASNLLGAMVGGALEYLALLTGFRALLILVALLYGVAFALATRLRVLADTELVPGTALPEAEPAQARAAGLE
jgi:SAM-dependent methyltransferase